MTDEREEFETMYAFSDFLTEIVIEEILVELLHGNPEIAKACLKKATESAFQKFVKENRIAA